jgi:hypothetical protein
MLKKSDLKSDAPNKDDSNKQKAHGMNYILPSTILGFPWNNVVFTIDISENMDLDSREHFSNLKQCPMILFGGEDVSIRWTNQCIYFVQDIGHRSTIQ